MNSSIVLDQETEEATRQLLRQHFAPCYKERIDNYVNSLLSKESYIGRFKYLQAVIGSDVFCKSSKILISGFGAGSEMLIAREFGFGEVHGVEVEKIWVDACRIRMENLVDMFPSYYKGDKLPYPDCTFSTVISGHIIEHTADPQIYINEALRVLKEGGYFFLEFPNRYFHKELHTGLPSFEWLPSYLRSSMLRLLSSKYSPLAQDVKFRFDSIVVTKLKQVSMGWVRFMLSDSGFNVNILALSKPCPGIVRCVIQKQSNVGANQHGSINYLHYKIYFLVANRLEKLIKQLFPPPLDYNQHINFGLLFQDSAKYKLYDGFEEPEKKHIWTTKQSAELSIEIESQSIIPEVDYLLSLRAVPFSPNQLGRHQHVDLCINKQFVTRWNIPISSLEINTFAIKIPGTILLKYFNRIDMSFNFSKRKSPKDLGINADPRALGFALVDLTLKRIFRKNIEKPTQIMMSG